ALDVGRLAEAADPHRLTVPALLLHGPDDRIAPWETSRAFAAARPDLVQLHTAPGARHAAAWNVDPHRYEDVLSRFLTPHM
ncbi:serine aminopeptidase domain-containing protein, partial [Streptomyces sparsus]